MIKIKEQMYSSTNGFVTINKLGLVARRLLGADWEPEDDVEQIKALLKEVGRTDLRVKYHEGMKSNEDIEVFSQEVLRQTAVIYFSESDIDYLREKILNSGGEVDLAFNWSVCSEEDNIPIDVNIMVGDEEEVIDHTNKNEE